MLRPPCELYSHGPKAPTSPATIGRNFARFRVPKPTASEKLLDTVTHHTAQRT